MTSTLARYDTPVTIGPVLRYAILFIVAGGVLIPLLATALGGFKSLGELRVNPFGLPSVWEWSNYWDILASSRYWQLMGNSLIIAVLTVFLTVATAAMAAFVFVHVRFFGATFLLNYLLLGLLFPAATAILPLFIKIRDLGLLDTYWGVVLPQVAFGLAMSILLFRNAFRQLPRDLFEAALIDGCGYFRFFWHVVLPLSRPILATVWGQGPLPPIADRSLSYCCSGQNRQSTTRTGANASACGSVGRASRRSAHRQRWRMMRLGYVIPGRRTRRRPRISAA
jgi:raffinose/stachyose/melibiose transport system permease protein